MLLSKKIFRKYLFDVRIYQLKLYGVLPIFLWKLYGEVSKSDLRERKKEKNKKEKKKKKKKKRKYSPRFLVPDGRRKEKDSFARKYDKN